MAKQQELALKEKTEVASLLDAAMDEDAGKGISSQAADNLVSLMYVLQGLSPQIEEANPSYIPGAKAGDIWLRNFDDPIVKGSQGILFQPCARYEDYVEWTPRERGGGFVERHEKLPANAIRQSAIKVTMPNGNELRETRYVAGLVHLSDGRRVPFVIPFSSTGHTVARGWNTAMSQHVDKKGRIMPAFRQLWLLKTRQRSNTKGKWYVLEPVFDGEVTTIDDYNRGKALWQAFDSGQKRPEAPMDEGDGAEDADADAPM